nr:hypothetical protein [Flavobacterium sp. ASV13]
MIKKERVLVRDNKGIFLKMFKRKFKNEFDFSEDSFLLENENNKKDFDRSIFVVYDNSELLNFFELDHKGTNVMVCLFNKNLHNSFSFIEGIKDLILIDASKTRTEVFEDLKEYFKNSSNLIPKLPQMKFEKGNMPKAQFDNFQKALYFMM